MIARAIRLHALPFRSPVPCCCALLGSAASRPVRPLGNVLMATGASPATPIDDGDWLKIGSHLEAYESQRDGIMRQCRDVQKKCKQAVYFLHRGNLDDASRQVTEAESLASAMLPTLRQYPAMRQGSFSFAMEEYVEAVAFKVFLEEGRLAKSSELPLVEPEEYMGGVLDFTDELSRYAIQRATVRDTQAVQRCRDLVDAILGQFLQFDLRNSSLRKKYDGLKYTLKKLENTMYELSLVEATAP